MLDSDIIYMVRITYIMPHGFARHNLQKISIMGLLFGV